MAKLWDKGYTLDALIEQFTVGDDPFLDHELIYYDCIGSIAHARMLAHIGILTLSEYHELKRALKDIIAHARNGSFSIHMHDEDVHTAVENWLVAHLKDIGKKIHTGRSRNDQVLLDTRLYMRDKLLDQAEAVIKLCTSLLEAAEKYKEVPMPGRTHFQRAMPSSVGLLLSAYGESLLDNLELLKSCYHLVDQCPLGAAASYGVNLPLDRAMVARLLGFDRVQNNVLYVNNSRGKLESTVLHALSQIMIDLSKIATDLILFSAPEFGYFRIPQELCSGSSLMPQKRNPCGLELVRAKSATVMSYLMQTLTIIRGLPSGYNRDFQETKRPLMHGFAVTESSLKVCAYTIQSLEIDYDACMGSITPELFATDQALRLVQEGCPFREAYRQVAQSPEKYVVEDVINNIRAKTHQGAPGNLGLELHKNRAAKYAAWAECMRLHVNSTFEKLLEEM